MTAITWLPEAVTRPRRLAVGEFDGVHLGHRQVIEGADTVLTFDPHPRAVVAPHAAPKLLTSLPVKADLVGRLGARELVVIPFDGAFARQSPQAFIDDVLVAHLGAEWISVGRNFRFGHRASGDVALLRRQTAFETRVVEMLELDGEEVSSTRIRALVEAGDVAAAAALLGHPFELRGAVQHGDMRGRTLGYPTANLVPDDQHVCPGHGIYACRAAVRDGDAWRSFTAAVSVGVRPTFVTGRGVLVEAFLLDFAGDLYGQELRLEFLAWLRGEERFESAEALVAQMERDVEQARSLVADNV